MPMDGDRSIKFIEQYCEVGMEITLYQQTLDRLPNIDLTKEWNIDQAIEFFDFAKTVPDCAGLAAPQCGINKRYCAIREESGLWTLAINPRMSASDGIDFESKEGCKSWPGSVIVARRYKKIEIEYNPIECFEVRNQIKRIVEGFQAIVWQHEIDHLNGVEEKFLLCKMPPRKVEEKVGRNDPCPCGSGLKSKKCCWR